MRLMAIKDINNKILGFFNLQSPSLQVSWFKVLSNDFNDKGEFILNLKYYGKNKSDHHEIILEIY